ncbi:MAG: TetR/AcrR family transcriptional regulator [Desulfovibrio sp.]|nr:TetR/AcrR family transcriptional regulator [Desulfovibrio sp.]
MTDKAGKERTRGRPREFDRDRALRDALRVFWSQGYLNTTMAQLCEAMGIKSPSLYCAFGCKADLFLEALEYYREAYWREAFARFMAEPDIRAATANLFRETARILLLPDAPCGCLTVYTALTLPASETRVLNAISVLRRDTKKMFRAKLMAALKDGQLPVTANIPAIAGALTNFFEGLTLQARDDLCLAELTEIAALGARLLPEKA